MKKKKLSHSLSSQQMQMIALGGTIGVGLFMGSNAAIKFTGPGIIVAYLVAWLVLYLIMRALAEMLYLKPTTGSFADLATEYIHPLGGYLTAWSNIIQWVLVGISEVIAVGQYLKFWWPHFPTWIAGVVVVVILCLANLASVKFFGEIESGFSLIKIITIIMMIILGALVIFLGLGNHGKPLGFDNLWKNGGFLTGGWQGFLFSLSLVMGSYQGIEILGITVGEAKNVRKNTIKSTKSILFKILALYEGAIIIIVALYPWNQLGNLGSPFVNTFAKVGIPFAASIINFVVLTAALTGCNSGIFSSSRMLYTLGQKGEVSPIFAKVSRERTPYWSVIAICCGIFIGVVIDYFLPLISDSAGDIFTLFYSSSILPGMMPWFVILISHLIFRKRNSDKLNTHPFKMPGAPITNYLALSLLILVLIFMFINPETRISIIIGLSFEIVLVIVYVLRHRQSTHSED